MFRCINIVRINGSSIITNIHENTSHYISKFQISGIKRVFTIIGANMFLLVTDNKNVGVIFGE